MKLWKFVSSLVPPLPPIFQTHPFNEISALALRLHYQVVSDLRTLTGGTLMGIYFIRPTKQAKNDEQRDSQFTASSRDVDNRNIAPSVPHEETKKNESVGRPARKIKSRSAGSKEQGWFANQSVEKTESQRI
jgi:hypothetical protein